MELRKSCFQIICPIRALYPEYIKILFFRCLNIDIILNISFLENKMQHKFFSSFSFWLRYSVAIWKTGCFPVNHGGLIGFSDTEYIKTPMSQK